MTEATPTQPPPPSANRQFGAFLTALSERTPAEQTLAGQTLAGRKLALFLDYDGTLAPIVDRPEQALLSDATRSVIAKLAALCTVAVVSGRDLDDVHRMVGLDTLVYAGSHGFDIRGPNLRLQIGLEYVPALERAAAALRERLGAGKETGVLVEHKRFAVAVHTRLASPEAKSMAAAAVRAVAAGENGLRITGGKEILELRPNLPWDKGRAVLALLDALGGPDTLPLYIGDDETDEDALRALHGRGIGIRVMDSPTDSAADWSLADPYEVRLFLERLQKTLAERHRAL